MQEAKRIAEANGYYTTFFDKDSDILLDPLFWQALGEGLGWDDFVFDSDGTKATEYSYELSMNGIVKGWVYKQYDFIDHLAEGKDIESFFNELTK